MDGFLLFSENMSIFINVIEVLQNYVYLTAELGKILSR